MFMESHVSLSNGRVGVHRGRREEKLNGVDPGDDLVDLLQVLEHHVLDGKIVGERWSSVVGVSGQHPVDGFVVGGLKKFLEAVGGVGKIGEAKWNSYVHVGCGKVSDLVEQHLVRKTRRETD